MRSFANERRLKKRRIAQHQYEVFNSTQCVEKYGKYIADSLKWKHKWHFKRKGFVPWKDVPGYIFLEKYVHAIFTFYYD